MNRIRFITVVITIAFVLGTNTNAQTSVFTYQGSLTDSGGFADGIYDFQFTLHSTLAGGSPMDTDEHLAVEVLDGLFTVDLDFGAFFFSSTSPRFLEIAVRFDGDPTYTTLDPRIQLNSAPYALHADIANYASSGPFAPEDTSPTSTSGTGPNTQGVSYTLNIDGQVFTNFELQFPVTISRAVFMNGSELLAGSHEQFSVVLSRSYDPSSPWHNLYATNANPVSIDIAVFGGFLDSTTFSFTDGVVNGYRLKQDAKSGLQEVLTISFGDAKNIPFDPIVSRTSQHGFTEAGHPPFSPYLGGDAVLPGRFTFSYDGFVPPHSSVGAFPNESKPTINGQIAGSSEAQTTLILLHNVLADRFSTIFESFLHDHTPQSLELRDNATVIWTPGITSTTGVIISGWTLDQADEGGLYETYIIEYLAE